MPKSPQGIEAWIELDSKKVDEYKVKRKGHKGRKGRKGQTSEMECFIPCESGKGLKIACSVPANIVKKHNCMIEVDFDGYIFYVADNRIEKDPAAQGPVIRRFGETFCCRCDRPFPTPAQRAALEKNDKFKTNLAALEMGWCSVRCELEYRPLSFDRLESTDDDSFLEVETREFGEIGVTVSTVDRFSEVVTRTDNGQASTSARHEILALVKSMPAPETPVGPGELLRVHETLKNRRTHGVVWGDEVTNKKHIVNLKPEGKKAICSFVFQYRDIGILKADKIAPVAPDEPIRTPELRNATPSGSTARPQLRKGKQKAPSKSQTPVRSRDFTMGLRSRTSNNAHGTKPGQVAADEVTEDEEEVEPNRPGESNSEEEGIEDENAGEDEEEDEYEARDKNGEPLGTGPPDDEGPDDDGLDEVQSAKDGINVREPKVRGSIDRSEGRSIMKEEEKDEGWMEENDYLGTNSMDIDGGLEYVTEEERSLTSEGTQQAELEGEGLGEGLVKEEDMQEYELGQDGSELDGDESSEQSSGSDSQMKEEELEEYDLDDLETVKKEESEEQELDDLDEVKEEGGGGEENELGGWQDVKEEVEPQVDFSEHLGGRGSGMETGQTKVEEIDRVLTKPDHEEGAFDLGYSTTDTGHLSSNEARSRRSKIRRLKEAIDRRRRKAARDVAQVEVEKRKIRKLEASIEKRKRKAARDEERVAMLEKRLKVEDETATIARHVKSDSGGSRLRSSEVRNAKRGAENRSRVSKRVKREPET